MLLKLLSGRGRLITHFSGWALVTLVAFYLLSSIRPPGEAAGRTALFVFFPAVLFYTNARVLTNRFFEARGVVYKEVETAAPSEELKKESQNDAKKLEPLVVIDNQVKNKADYSDAENDDFQTLEDQEVY